MPQSLAQVWLHLVFSTKERRPFLQDDVFREDFPGRWPGLGKHLGLWPGRGQWQQDKKSSFKE